MDGAYSAARGEMCACGCVILDPSSPVFVGALEHTSSTGELSALIEALWWLLEEDTHPKSSVLLRPDSEYAMAGWRQQRVT